MSKIQRYLVLFSDGRSATVLDTTGEESAAFMAWLSTFFRSGFVLEVTHVC